MSDAFPLPALEPTRDARATLPDLIEVLLDKGVVLHLDLIISVADIPLIGVNLKAAIAGIETMLEFGMMRQWDEQTRGWVQRSISRTVPFAEGEELVMRMTGGFRHTGLYTTWRPGTVYVTDRRLFVFRRDPREMLWETALTDIQEVSAEPEVTIGSERRRIRVRLNNGSEALLSAAEPDRLADLVRERTRRFRGAPRVADAGSMGPPAIRQGHLWYHEPRAGSFVWRGGGARLTESGISWKSPVDARAALDVPYAEMLDTRLESGNSPKGSLILVIDTAGGSFRLAGDGIADWAGELTRARGRSSLPAGTRSDATTW